MNQNLTNLIIATILSITVIFGWQYFVEKPRLREIAQQKKLYQQNISNLKQKSLENTNLSRQQAIKQVDRVKISSKSLAGSISLKGLRFDDLILNQYKQELKPDSPPVELFSPSKVNNSYFAELGWWSRDKNITYPTSETIWQSSSATLTPERPVILSWRSPENILFQVEIALDDNYLFTISQSTLNQSTGPISLQYYGLINQDYEEQKKSSDNNLLDQGMIGAIGHELKEVPYDKLRKRKSENYPYTQVSWLGITNKYWLTALIPDQSEQYNANYNYAIKSGRNKYQADFISKLQLLEPGEEYKLTHHLFAGAKKVDLLDYYENKYNIYLFDRSIDFGWFYILTKPIFHAMNFFYKYVGNFGLSIMIVTILIKLLMFGFANKSYRSMGNMKRLQPQIERLKTLYADDKARLNQEVMQLYKREKVNPVSGCLPLLVQIPVFFSIYKVLHVTIEMRHAPFFGWIKDLSAPDPTTIFNLFGLLPFTPPNFLMIGVWPLIMALTMYLQQRMSPQPADPVQAQVMKFLPLMFLFMFSSFPVGLLIYWSWNNLLSIIQQSYINRLSKKNG